MRVLGAIGAVELDGIADREALKRRLVEAGVRVRPFGNVVYLTPALTIAADELAVLTGAVGRCAVSGPEPTTPGPPARQPPVPDRPAANRSGRLIHVKTPDRAAG